LKTIYSQPQTPPEVGGYAFLYVPEDAVVYVPDGSIAAYSAAKEWSRFFDFREMPTTGVSELDVDCDARPADVYNMQGVLVKARASQDEIDALAPGLYIIAGRKVLVK